METENIALGKSPLSVDEQTAQEERDRQRYSRQPQQLGEVLAWERVASWPGEH